MNKIEPKVSVIIPCYNVEKYVRECVDSVLNQTLKDIEIIIINDGSTDGTRQVLKEYEEIENVHILDQENMGLSASRNKGLDMASGKYVYFLDSDDEIESDVLESAFGQMEELDLDQLLINAYEYNDGEREKIVFIQYENEYEGVQTGRQMLAAMHVNNEYISCVPYRMIRRQLLVDSGLRFYVGIIHEDELFTFKLMMITKRCAFNGKLNYIRRNRVGSITHSIQYEKKWNGLSVLMHDMVNDDLWRDSSSQELYWIKKRFAQFFVFAADTFCDMDARQRDEHKKEYSQLLLDAKGNNWYNDKKVKLIGMNRQLYIAYRQVVKKVKKAIYGHY